MPPTIAVSSRPSRVRKRPDYYGYTKQNHLNIGNHPKKKSPFSVMKKKRGKTKTNDDNSNLIDCKPEATCKGEENSTIEQKSHDIQSKDVEEKFSTKSKESEDNFFDVRKRTHSITSHSDCCILQRITPNNVQSNIHKQIYRKLAKDVGKSCKKEGKLLGTKEEKPREKMQDSSITKRKDYNTSPKRPINHSICFLQNVSIDYNRMQKSRKTKDKLGTSKHVTTKSKQRRSKIKPFDNSSKIKLFKDNPTRGTTPKEIIQDGIGCVVSKRNKQDLLSTKKLNRQRKSKVTHCDTTKEKESNANNQYGCTANKSKSNCKKALTKIDILNTANNLAEEKKVFDTSRSEQCVSKEKANHEKLESTDLLSLQTKKKKGESLHEKKKQTDDVQSRQITQEKTNKPTSLENKPNIVNKLNDKSIQPVKSKSSEVNIRPINSYQKGKVCFDISVSKKDKKIIDFDQEPSSQKGSVFDKGCSPQKDTSCIISGKYSSKLDRLVDIKPSNYSYRDTFEVKNHKTFVSSSQLLSIKTDIFPRRKRISKLKAGSKRVRTKQLIKPDNMILDKINQKKDARDDFLASSNNLIGEMLEGNVDKSVPINLICTKEEKLKIGEENGRTTLPEDTNNSNKTISSNDIDPKPYSANDLKRNFSKKKGSKLKTRDFPCGKCITCLESSDCGRCGVCLIGSNTNKNRTIDQSRCLHRRCLTPGFLCREREFSHKDLNDKKKALISNLEEKIAGKSHSADIYQNRQLDIESLDGGLINDLSDIEEFYDPNHIYRVPLQQNSPKEIKSPEGKYEDQIFSQNYLGDQNVLDSDDNNTKTKNSHNSIDLYDSYIESNDRFDGRFMSDFKEQFRDAAQIAKLLIQKERDTIWESESSSSSIRSL